MCVSVERQIAVEYFNPTTEWQVKKYVFKCHQQMVNGKDYVWPVNSLVFHLVCIAYVCLCMAVTDLCADTTCLHQSAGRGWC